MNDYIVIGECPYDEDSLQVGRDSSIELKKQAQRFADGIKRYYSKKISVFPLNDFAVSIKRNEHDFGTYYDAIVQFNPDNEEAVNLAYEIESQCPVTWDELETLKD